MTKRLSKRFPVHFCNTNYAIALQSTQTDPRDDKQQSQPEIPDRRVDCHKKLPMSHGELVRLGFAVWRYVASWLGSTLFLIFLDFRFDREGYRRNLYTHSVLFLFFRKFLDTGLDRNEIRNSTVSTELIPHFFFFKNFSRIFGIC